jgi:hypothetical protein
MERSIAASPETALYHRNICEVYRSLGRYDDALAAGHRAVGLTPRDPTPTTISGSCTTIAPSSMWRSTAPRARPLWTPNLPERIPELPRRRFCAAISPLGGIRVALSARQCAQATAADRSPERPPAIDRRPGLWRCNPVRTLSSVGSSALSRYRRRLQF